MVRQKLDIAENFCACLDKSNKYRAAVPPSSSTEVWMAEDWEDQKFWDAKQLFYMKEDSNLFCRLFCPCTREFTMSARNEDDDSELFNVHKPFKPTMICGCFELCPQEITTFNPDGTKIGMVVHDFRCMAAMCGKQYWQIKDENDKVIYNVEDNTCCNANMCAPSFCCKTRTFDIFDAEQTQAVGKMQNLFSCNLKRLCFSGYDQYRIAFPKDATPEQKALIVSNLMLIEFSMFERSSAAMG